jgi:isopenicillin N synthase-like dioxygenase
MTCVPCTSEPGLNILDPYTGQWIELERFLKPIEEVTVFCASTFEELSGNRFPGGIHRVAKSFKPRMSMVYELRPRAGFST